MHNIYRTNYGDTFDIISLNVYGNEKYSHEIIQNNPSLSNIIIFEYGVNVNIPDIDIQDISTLPPWKR